MLALCVHAGMDEAVRDTALHIRFNGPSDGEAQQQIDLVSEAIDNQAYGIALMPPRLYSLNGVVRRALARGIPVVVLLHPVLLPLQKHLSLVVEDPEAGASLAAARVRSVAAAGSHVLIVGLDRLSAGEQERLSAVEAALRAVSPQTSVAMRMTHSADGLAFGSALQNALARDRRIDTVIALDSRAGLLAATVVHEGGAGRHIELISFDQSAEVLAALREGVVDAVIAQDMRTMGRLAVKNILQDHKGQSVAAITRVPPLLITRANIDSAGVQRVLLMNWVEQ